MQPDHVTGSFAAGACRPAFYEGLVAGPDGVLPDCGADSYYLSERRPAPAVVLQPEPALPDTPFRSAYGYFRLKQDGARDTELEEYILRVFGSGNAKQK